MDRPKLEIADIFRAHGHAWRQANVGHVSLSQLRVMSAIEACRTEADGEDCSEPRFMAEPTHEMARAFKTLSLRGAADRPPYMHAGQFGTLDDVLTHYAAAPEALEGHSELGRWT